MRRGEAVEGVLLVVGEKAGKKKARSRSGQTGAESGLVWFCGCGSGNAVG